MNNQQQKGNQMNHNTYITLDADIKAYNFGLTKSEEWRIVQDSAGTTYALNERGFSAAKLLIIARNAMVVEVHPYGSHEDCREPGVIPLSSEERKRLGMELGALQRLRYKADLPR